MAWVRQNLLTLAAMTVIASGCATGNTTLNDVGIDGATVVRVTNNNWSDMTIYLVRDGTRHRLGSVTSQGTHIFAIPTHLVTTTGSLHLMADPIGSARTFVSSPILLSPGQTAEWQLENSLALSSIWIR